MKLLKMNVQGLKLFTNPLDIEFVTHQKVMEEDKEDLFRVSSKLYQNTAVALIGINASGKTSTLKVISFMMQILNHDSINKIEEKVILQGLRENEEVVLESYFSWKSEYLYKLRTVIKVRLTHEEGKAGYYISDETLWKKELTRVLTRKSAFDFSESMVIQKRKGDEEFLPDDVSIIISQNKKNDARIYFKDLIQWTNVNLIRVVGDFPKELIQYLDPSIEYLAFDLDQDEKKLKGIRLKFRGKDEINMNHQNEVEMYLSSGTVKGINVFIHALTVLENGGYLILDELENHFNKEIATSLLRLFMDQRINKRGAAIIFSTHYPEILDRLSRNDNIYFVRNTDGIRVDNLGRLLKRSDLKKSDVYQSAFIKGTAPQYEAYQAMKRAFSSIVNGEA